MTTRQRALLALYRRLKAEGRDRDAAQVMETIMVIELQQNRARETSPCPKLTNMRLGPCPTEISSKARTQSHLPKGLQGGTWS